MRFRTVGAGVLGLLLAGNLVAPSVTAGVPQEAGAALSDAAPAAECVPELFRRPPRPGYAHTTWPTEHADAWRSHAVADGLPAGVMSKQLRTTAVKLPPVPVWGYVGKGDVVYVMGGAPYLLDMFTKLIQGAPQSSAPLLVAQSKLYAASMTPYIARINTRTMEAEVLQLPGGDSVNYIGGALIHANGSVYAVARSVLYKINPRTFRVVASVKLPLAPKPNGAPNRETAYNGMVATQSGDLVLKGWASVGGGDEPPGVLLRVDAGDLSIKAQKVTTAVAAARMAIVLDQGREYLYFPNQTQSVRFALSESAFNLDGRWSATYLREGSGMTAASSDVFMGKGVVFASNTEPTATTPMSVFSQGIDANGSIAKSTPFKGIAPGWNFFMMAGDPYRSGISVVEDQVSGHAAGYLTCGGGQGVKKIWENSSITASAGMAINSAAGHLYTDDRVCDARGRCRMFLVVLDLRTGVEIARTAVRGNKPTIGQIFIGPEAVYYVATNTDDPNGYVTRVTAARP
ncbi:MAG: hypothetical protein ACKOT0_12025 [bacterium]